MSEQTTSSWYRTPFGRLVARSQFHSRRHESVQEAVARRLQSS